MHRTADVEASGAKIELLQAMTTVIVDSTDETRQIPTFARTNDQTEGNRKANRAESGRGGEEKNGERAKRREQFQICAQYFSSHLSYWIWMIRCAGGQRYHRPRHRRGSREGSAPLPHIPSKVNSGMSHIAWTQ